MKALALIPARSGSKRVKNKNIYELEGHPLLAYAIRSALDSNCFDAVHVCTDSLLYSNIAIKYGASCPSLRPDTNSHSTSPDASWIQWFFSEHPEYRDYDYAAILRPTSPFRKPVTIERAFRLFLASKSDTLRAVRQVSEHPGKMWIDQCGCIVPLIPLSMSGVPFHSNQTCALFTCYVQDASLEIFTIANFLSNNSITGASVLPFFNQDNEGFDINTPSDIIEMHRLIDSNLALPYRI
jgi:CMP-N,N'-diacetyllegionaminic acid synthase